MSKGGKRANSGRKKIGTLVSFRIEEEILRNIEKKFDGNSKADSIRQCIKKGLESIDGKNTI